MAWILLCLAGLTGAQALALEAYVWEAEDTSMSNLGGLSRLLADAGFSVKPLPKDRAPAELKADLIVFSSFANLDADYAGYKKKQAGSLRKFVEGGGVLLQLAQKEESQISQPFLPEGMRATRGDAVLDDIRVTQPDHPLMKGLADAGGKVHLPEHIQLKPGWNAFMEQQGGAVLMGAGPGINDPVLLEASDGKGRFLLASLFFDRLRDDKGELKAPAEYADFAKKFAGNLALYVKAVREEQAPVVKAAPKPVPLPFVLGSWTLAVMPDTQYYSRSYPEVFESQTKWIAEHVKDRNIKYALHLGDITTDNLETSWVNAQRAMSHLDGKVPFALVGGNHDYGPGGNSANRESFLNKYFPISKYEGWSTFGGAMEPGKIDNTYHLFEAGGKKWIVLALEWLRAMR